MVVNNPLRRRYFLGEVALGGVPLDSHEKKQVIHQSLSFPLVCSGSINRNIYNMDPMKVLYTGRLPIWRFGTRGFSSLPDMDVSEK